jgi:hypothetical protein
MGAAPAPQSQQDRTNICLCLLLGVEDLAISRRALQPCSHGTPRKDTPGREDGGGGADIPKSVRGRLTPERVSRHFSLSLSLMLT